jgi:hypothetical protein
MRRRRRVLPHLTRLDHLRIHTVGPSSAEQELAVVNARADLDLLSSRNENRVARDELNLIVVHENGHFAAHAVQELVIGGGPSRVKAVLALAEGDVSDCEVAIGLYGSREWRNDCAGAFVPVVRSSTVGQEVRRLGVVGERYISRMPSVAAYRISPIRRDLVNIVRLGSCLEFLSRESEGLVGWEWYVVLGSPRGADVGEEIVKACRLHQSEELCLLRNELVGVVVVGGDHGEVALAEIFGHAVGPDGYHTGHGDESLVPASVLEDFSNVAIVSFVAFLRISTYVVRRHSIVRLAVGKQHAEAIRSLVSLASASGVLVAQEAKDIVGEQDFWSIQMADDIWHWREREGVGNLNDLG